MPEETRIFDVAKPGHSSPNPNSRPIIVGHHPSMSDPMVRAQGQDSPTQITIQDSPAEPLMGGAPTAPETGNGIFGAPEPDLSMLNHESEPQLPSMEPGPPAASAGSAVFPTEEPALPPPANTEEPLPPMDPPAHVEGLHVASAKRRSPLMKIVLGLLILLVAAYLLVDSGAIKTSINLPFHVFKQKAAPAAPASPSTSSNQANSTALPAGFTEYKISGTSLTFAAPTIWGTPTSSTDAGYSARGGANKPSGTYAYIVDFPTNKDVEVAVTSSKYLPAARATLYYDFLQWCMGTNDGKFYETAMHFTTSSDKIDTPSTTSCDQGPVDAIKIDISTIVQTKAKSTDGKVIGDIYTKNLQNTDLPVFRVKDLTSSNSANIKQLLTTVKIPAAGASTSSGQ